MLPVLLFEDVRPFAATRRSWELLRDSFGKTVVNNLFLVAIIAPGLITGSVLFGVGMIILLVHAGRPAACGVTNPWVGFASLAVGLTVVMAAIHIVFAAEGVLNVSLNGYARARVLDPGLSRDLKIPAGGEPLP